jgi:glyoxylase-like metal-dependent hydrolase (beta-lactamase superfamily II)
MLHEHVAEGVHRIEDAYTNWYLVEDGGRLTVVDTGLPRSWDSLRSALEQLGRTFGDIEAVVLTHGHFDHVGFARRAREELGVPVFVPRGEEPVVAHPWRYDHERSRLPYARHPSFLRVFATMTLAGAPVVKGLEDVRFYDPGATLDLPGSPEVVSTPGHTHAHCSLHLRDRGVLLAGDAVVMHDVYTGRHGPCVVAGAATADTARALVSLDAVAATGAQVVLTGHGEPWTGGAVAAAELAREAGGA